MSDLVLVEKQGKVGVITINRPDALNAVNHEVMDGIISNTRTFDDDADVGCIVITGAGKAFIAGADIKEMHTKSYMDMYIADKQSEW